MKVIEIAPANDAWQRDGNVLSAPCGDRIYQFTIEENPLEIPDHVLGAWLSGGIAMCSYVEQIVSVIKNKLSVVGKLDFKTK